MCRGARGRPALWLLAPLNLPCARQGSRTCRSATLALRDRENGDLAVKCHAGCTRADILDELRRRGLLDGSADRCPEAPPVESPTDRARRIASACRVWGIGRDARGTPVARYLAGRGIDTEPPPCLRWASRCWHAGERAELPAMLARVDGPDGERVGVHRTYLRRDPDGTWHRRDRASLGLIGGGAVHLAEPWPGAPLVIAEGIESALAAVLTPGLMLGHPAWAALSAGGIQALVLPDAVRDIIIACDRDPSGVGEKKARAAACRWLREGRRVRLVIPDRIGADPNDLLREARRGAA